MSEAAFASGVCDITHTMAADDEPLLYRQLMAIRPGNMTLNAWLVSSGVNRSFFADLKRSGKARSDTIDKLIETAGVTKADFYGREAPSAKVEDRQSEQRSNLLPFRRLDEPRDIPLLGTAMGADYEIGDDGSPIFAELMDVFQGDGAVDYLRRPPSLANKDWIYGISMVGASMSPRFDPGDPAYVDPKATPRISDDVVVYLRRPADADEQVYSVLVKRLVKRTSTYLELEQFNPATTFRIEMRDVARIHRIIPWREMATF